MLHTLVDIAVLLGVFWYGTKCGQDAANKTGWWYKLTSKI